VTRSRHRAVTITIDGHPIHLGHVVTEAQEADLLRILNPALTPEAADCHCETPPHLTDDCRGGACGMCLGWLPGGITPCGCDHHVRVERDQLTPEDAPPNVGYLERWLRHWQDRALRAEARIAGEHARAADARRREILAEARSRDCAYHGRALVDYAQRPNRMNDLIDPYEQLRLGVIGLHIELGEAARRGQSVDAAAVDKALKKLIDACKRGLEKATAVAREREASA